MAGEADKERLLSSSACRIGGPNSVNPGQILLVYGINFFVLEVHLVIQKMSQMEICHKFEEGNCVIICERFRDKSIKLNLCSICEFYYTVFVSFHFPF